MSESSTKVYGLGLPPSLMLAKPGSADGYQMGHCVHVERKSKLKHCKVLPISSDDLFQSKSEPCNERFVKHPWS